MLHELHYAPNQMLRFSYDAAFPVLLTSPDSPQPQLRQGMPVTDKLDATRLCGFALEIRDGQLHAFRDKSADHQPIVLNFSQRRRTVLIRIGDQERRFDSVSAIRLLDGRIEVDCASARQPAPLAQSAPRAQQVPPAQHAPSPAAPQQRTAGSAPVILEPARAPASPPPPPFGRFSPAHPQAAQNAPPAKSQPPFPQQTAAKQGAQDAASAQSQPLFPQQNTRPQAAQNAAPAKSQPPFPQQTAAPSAAGSDIAQKLRDAERERDEAIARAQRAESHLQAQLARYDQQLARAELITLNDAEVTRQIEIYMNDVKVFMNGAALSGGNAHSIQVALEQIGCSLEKVRQQYRLLIEHREKAFKNINSSITTGNGVVFGDQEGGGSHGRAA